MKKNSLIIYFTFTIFITCLKAYQQDCPNNWELLKNDRSKKRQFRHVNDINILLETAYKEYDSLCMIEYKNFSLGEIECQMYKRYYRKKIIKHLCEKIMKGANQEVKIKLSYLMGNCEMNEVKVYSEMPTNGEGNAQMLKKAEIIMQTDIYYSKAMKEYLIGFNYIDKNKISEAGNALLNCYIDARIKNALRFVSMGDIYYEARKKCASESKYVDKCIDCFNQKMIASYQNSVIFLEEFVVEIKGGGYRNLLNGYLDFISQNIESVKRLHKNEKVN